MARRIKNSSGKGSYIAHTNSDKQNSWFDDVKGRFQNYDAAANDNKSQKSRVSINRVPVFLKNLNTNAYVPLVVSLGLFHHRVEHPLSQIEQYKVEAVHRTVKRLPENTRHASFLVERVQKWLPEILESYEEKVECGEEMLAWMFTLDACFLLEILRLLSDEKAEWNIDPVFNRNRVRSCQFDILSDILMLENQIPIIILIELMTMEEKQMTKEGRQTTVEKEHLTKEEAQTALLQMICNGVIAIVHPFSYYLQPKEGEQEGERIIREAKLNKVLGKYKKLEDYNHILGFFHDFIVRERPEGEGEGEGEGTTAAKDRHQFPIQISIARKEKKSLRKEGDFQYQTLMASAVELYKNGVKFKSYVGVPSGKSIRFEKRNHTIYLPKIWITDTTEVVFRNLMAVDVCQEEQLTVISEYVFLMNSLIETEADVGLLRKKGIIQTSVGTDKEACDMFNGLAKGVNMHIADKDEFEELKRGVNEWYTGRIMYQVSEITGEHPRLMKAVYMFWGVVILLAAAVPNILTVLKNFIANNQNNQNS